MITSTCGLEEIQVNFLARRTVRYRGRHIGKDAGRRCDTLELSVVWQIV